MTEYTLPGANGYAISLLSSLRPEHESILLCLHGFAGDKYSSVIAALAEELDGAGMGVAAFDWPAHGKSPAGEEKLTVENCLADLNTVLMSLRETRGLPVSCFATSFGGYLATLYRNQNPKIFHKLVLRSPALRMAQTLLELLPEEERARYLAGETLERGFERKLRLNLDFYRSLRAHNAYDAPVAEPERVLILQGALDDVVLPGDTAAYAERNGIRVEWFPEADHRYKKPGERERIVELTRAFLLGKG